MTFHQAFKAAQLLAGSTGDRLGECLLAHRVVDTDAWPIQDAWVLSFDIIDGPEDWCWFVMISPTGEGSVMYASSNRPDPTLAPCIQRRWWGFGPRELVADRLDWDRIGKRELELAKEILAARKSAMAMSMDSGS